MIMGLAYFNSATDYAPRSTVERLEATAVSAAVASRAGLPRRVMDALRAWRRRREARHALLLLSDRLLLDIGLDRAHVESVARRSRWLD